MYKKTVLTLKLDRNIFKAAYSSSKYAVFAIKIFPGHGPEFTHRDVMLWTQILQGERICGVGCHFKCTLRVFMENSNDSEESMTIKSFKNYSNHDFP